MATVSLSSTDKGSFINLSENNLRATTSTSGSGGLRANIGKNKGKMYWEVENISGQLYIGVSNDNSSLITALSSNTSNNDYRLYATSGKIMPPNISYGIDYTGKTVGVALDIDNSTLEFYVDGISQGVSHADLNLLNGNIYPFFWFGGTGRDLRVNFGATPFKFSVPVGYSSYQTLNKTLISLSSGEYKTWVNSLWETVSNVSPNRIIFENTGIEDLSIIPESAWQELAKQSPTIELVTYVPTGNTPSNITQSYDALEKNIKMNALPIGQLVVQKDDIKLYGSLTKAFVERLDDGLPQGVIRTIVSFDSGITWETFKNGIWINVDASNSEIIKSNGMTVSEIMNIKEDDYKSKLVINNKIKFAYYIEEHIRGINSSKLSKSSLSQKAIYDTPTISESSIYILNTVSTIDLSLRGKDLTGKIEDIDKGKVQYRVLLNGNPYYPQDGTFTEFKEAPLDISLRIDSNSIVVDAENSLRVEFKDYWGAFDYWGTTFIGTYNGLLFKDKTGAFYANDIGQVLKYLDIGTLIAGQKSEEFEIQLANSYGYDVVNPKIVSLTESVGFDIELSKSNSPFVAESELLWNQTLRDGESLKFYMRFATNVGTPPVMGGMFELRVNADKV